MQPAFRNVVAFLRNADITCGYNFLPRDIPYGNVSALYNIDIQRLRLSLTAMFGKASRHSHQANIRNDLNIKRNPYSIKAPLVADVIPTTSLTVKRKI